MIYTLGHISGAHFNPAVTLAFAIGRHMQTHEVKVFWFAQFLGASMASLVLWLILPAGKTFGAVHPMVPIAAALVWEIILSFFLMLVIVSVATDTRAVGAMAGSAIGAIVAICAYVGGPVTGAAMNPARAVGPVLFHGNFESLWIYFVGPGIGAVSAALVYKTFVSDTQKGSI
jgi:MIP family channel proteins